MLQQRHDGQLLTLHNANADQVYLACDCIGWFPMHRVDKDHWQATLTLPHGCYHLRYYVRQGSTIYWYDHEDMEVGSRSPPGLTRPHG